MGTNSQGISASISGDAIGADIDFTEVVSISVDGAVADVVEITPRTLTTREKGFRAGDRDHGTVSLVMRSVGPVLDDTYVGRKCNIQVSQSSPAAIFLDHDAIIQSFAWRATVGELQEYTVVLKLGAI